MYFLGLSNNVTYFAEQVEAARVSAYHDVQAGRRVEICKGLVEAHGGRIRAESPGPGRGTTVTFTIPAAGPLAAADPSEPPRILVDDDPRALRFVRDALARAGNTPVVTGAPEDLQRIIRTERPALVLLDLVLPGTDGIELMQRLPELSDLPVIFISAYGRDEVVVQALEMGAADYVVKPFSPTELVARVRTALRRRAEPEPFVLGDLAIDYGQRRVTVRGEAVQSPWQPRRLMPSKKVADTIDRIAGRTYRAFNFCANGSRCTATPSRVDPSSRGRLGRRGSPRSRSDTRRYRLSSRRI